MECFNAIWFGTFTACNEGWQCARHAALDATSPSLLLSSLLLLVSEGVGEHVPPRRLDEQPRHERLDEQGRHEHGVVQWLG